MHLIRVFRPDSIGLTRPRRWTDLGLRMVCSHTFDADRLFHPKKLLTSALEYLVTVTMVAPGVRLQTGHVVVKSPLEDGVVFQALYGQKCHQGVLEE